MRFTRKVPKKWDRRIVRRFAFKPCFLSPAKPSNTREVRWLEFVTLEQEYFGGTWFNERFVGE